MDNQHKLIKGYRELSQVEIDLINEIKNKAVEVQDLFYKVADHVNALVAEDEKSGEKDAQGLTALDRANPVRWGESARQDLQDGFMKLTRAVAQPTTF